MDGSGKSGITLDMSKTQIFCIDFQWLGAGRVRFGFVIDGNVYYCHEIKNANNLTTVYMTSGTLPLRYEIENTDTTASATSMKQICASVISEGGFSNDLGITHAASNGDTLISVTTRRPVLSFRPKTTFNSITNRATIIPCCYDIYSDTKSIFYEVVVNGTLTGASFVDAGSNAFCNYDVSATAISGGEIIAAGYVAASNQSKGDIASDIKNQIPLCNDIAGTSTDILTIVATSLSTDTNVGAEITWKEIY
jgi:hypothetical protein